MKKNSIISVIIIIIIIHVLSKVSAVISCSSSLSTHYSTISCDSALLQQLYPSFIIMLLLHWSGARMGYGFDLWTAAV